MQAKQKEEFSDIFGDANIDVPYQYIYLVITTLKNKYEKNQVTLNYIPKSLWNTIIGSLNISEYEYFLFEPDINNVIQIAQKKEHKNILRYIGNVQKKIRENISVQDIKDFGNFILMQDAEANVFMNQKGAGLMNFMGIITTHDLYRKYIDTPGYFGFYLEKIQYRTKWADFLTKMLMRKASMFREILG